MNFLKPYIIARRVRGLLLLSGIFVATSAWAYKFTVTSVEYMAASPMCRTALLSKLDNKEVAHAYMVPIGEENRNMIGRVGGWHYCGGVVRLQRAKGISDLGERASLVKTALQDIEYSYRKLPKAHWWAVDMAVSKAQGFEILGDYKKAFAVLDNVAEYHPESDRLELARGMIEYRRDAFEKALAHFQKADVLAGGQVAEHVYFAGLAAYKLGDYAQAETLAKRAQQMGYPFDGLMRMLADVPRGS